LPASAAREGVLSEPTRIARSGFLGSSAGGESAIGPCPCERYDKIGHKAIVYVNTIDRRSNPRPALHGIDGAHSQAIQSKGGTDVHPSASSFRLTHAAILAALSVSSFLSGAGC
jgi:hypothetical protein